MPLFALTVVNSGVFIESIAIAIGAAILKPMLEEDKAKNCRKANRTTTLTILVLLAKKCAVVYLMGTMNG